MHTPRILVAASALIASFTFSGCELFEEGFEQPVTVYSFPTGADVSIDGESVGKTPVTVELGRLKAHQLVLNKTGYKPQKETVLPSRNDEGKGLVRFGLMEDTGLYYDLGPQPVQAQLVPDVLPDSRGIDAYSEMATIITEVDQRRESGQIGPVEHKYIVDQIVNFYAN
ncbi:PEGA domain-containing protein [Cerasicoccus maritimus]|uniref:PEGA domain-containing protein n=1 Tax=Cerasicoccus maritimus TaxID=490089 RepID=UPI0028525821|nr:PEGA domain-containing protein [Cerasicoccus maritimus]